MCVVNFTQSTTIAMMQVHIMMQCKDNLTQLTAIAMMGCMMRVHKKIQLLSRVHKISVQKCCECDIEFKGKAVKKNHISNNLKVDT